MDVVVILIVVVLLVGLVAGGVAVTRGRRREVELEPPPSPGRSAAGTPTLDERPVTEPEAVPEPGDVAVPEAEAPTAPPEPEAAPEVVEPGPLVRPSFRERLGKARSALGEYVGAVLGRDRIDEETWDELEEALISADVGIDETTALLDELRERADELKIAEPELLLEQLKVLLKDRLAVADRSLRLDDGTTNVWLFVGVNGVGKTTTIGKVARRLRAEDRSVLMAAGDTFRAAAAEQLTMWADRTGAELVRGSEGGDPSSVIFDGVQRAAARGIDIVLADTAGRLHTKTNLMEELRKVRRVASREPGNVTEVLLVLDATTGQNGLVQAKQFTDAVDVTGVVLTKLDGSAKGGIVLAIQSQLGMPVKLVGLGETADDLVDFDPDEFVDALFA
ncbi:MAG: signal recognition particle-docking protein FtsY [Actinomycetota bacterium]|nr:signal recognition particle-docking protein FtsY [Actinomycetota bacterium]